MNKWEALKNGMDWLWLTATEKTWGYSSSSGFYFFDSLT
jgi:hypothetical protein